MEQSALAQQYLERLRKGTITKSERLMLAGGNLPDGKPCTPEIIFLLFADSEDEVRNRLSETIRRLDERNVVEITESPDAGPPILLFLAKHFYSSPRVGFSIVSNKNCTEEVLRFLQGKAEGSEELYIAESSDEKFTPSDRTRIEKEKVKDSSDDFELDDGDYEVTIDPSDSADDDVIVKIDDRSPSRDYEVTVETYEDDDVEVTIEMNDGGGAAGSEKTVVFEPEEPSIVTDRAKEQERETFDEAVNEIEGKFDEVFTVDKKGDKKPALDGSAFSDTSKFDSSRDERTIDDLNIGGKSGLEKQEKIDAKIEIPREKTTLVRPTDKKESLSVDESMGEVVLTRDRFVTRLPQSRYYQKTSPLEALSPYLRFVVPVFIVLLIIFTLWVSMPRGTENVENFDDSINRIFRYIKKYGFDANIKNPFPKGFSISTWKLKDNGDEVKVRAGNLGNDLTAFEKTYEEELKVSGLEGTITEKQQQLETENERLAEINNELLSLEEKKTFYLSILSEKTDISEKELNTMYKQEISAIEGEFAKIEKEVKSLEADLVDVRERISEFEKTYGKNKTSAGNEANKIELEDLTKKYNKIKPQYDALKSSLPKKKDAIKKKYQDIINSSAALDETNNRIEALTAEKVDLEVSTKGLESDVKSLKGELAAFLKSEAGSADASEKDLSTFIIMRHYVEEKSPVKDDTSMILRYTIYEKDATLKIDFVGSDGTKKGENYNVSFMRLETAKTLLFYRWNVDSTTWVLASITRVK